MDFLGNKTLKNLWNEIVSLRSDKTFLIFEDRNGNAAYYTYLEFDSLVNKVANGLRSIGVGYQDKVALHLNNSPEFLVSWLACAKIGAVMVPSNIHNVEDEIEYLLSFSDSKVVITEEEFLPRFEAVLPKVRNISVIIARTNHQFQNYSLFQDWLDFESSSEPDVHPKQSDILEIIFTSGTTSRPKGVLLTHANHLNSGQRISKHKRLTPNDISITALPLFHVNAQSLTVLGIITVGGTIVILEQYSASKFLNQIVKYKATRTSVVPMLLRTMLAQPPTPQDREHQLESISFAINVLDSEKEAFETRFGVELINGYGLSEAMTMVTVAPIDGIKRWPSIGLPAYDREVKIVDMNGNELPAGDIGEIIVRGIPGRTIMKGYYKNEAATAETIKDGWLYTGDNGFIDEHGYIYFFDRKKDVIKTAGENISATEVETTLIKHPLIKEAAVIGIPDEIRDEVLKAFIVLEDHQQLGEEDLILWCQQNMAKFKVPRIFEFRRELPHTSIGKLEKKVLRQQEEEKRKNKAY